MGKGRGLLEQKNNYILHPTNQPSIRQATSSEQWLLAAHENVYDSCVTAYMIIISPTSQASTRKCYLRSKPKMKWNGPQLTITRRSFPEQRLRAIIGAWRADFFRPTYQNNANEKRLRFFWRFPYIKYISKFIDTYTKASSPIRIKNEAIRTKTDGVIIVGRISEWRRRANFWCLTGGVA